jgi:hypothetical protein
MNANCLEVVVEGKKRKDTEASFCNVGTWLPDGTY